MRHGAKGEEEIWHEFADQPETLAFESKRLLANRLGQPIEQVADVDTGDLPPAGREREATVRVRVNQSFFRDRIFSAYNFRCCVTGLTVQPLLTASHIIPWAEDERNRLNPRNGLCLNPLHDRAFDRHLMWIAEHCVWVFIRGFLDQRFSTFRMSAASRRQSPKQFEVAVFVTTHWAVACHVLERSFGSPAVCQFRDKTQSS